MEEFSTQHDQESRSVVNLLRDHIRRLQERLEFIEDSKIFQDPESPSSSDSAHVPHQALITSCSGKPSRELRMRRNTRRDMSFPRGPDELHNTSRNLATSSGEEKDLRKVGAMNHCNQYLYLSFKREQEKKARRQKLSCVSDTHHATGIWTCIQSGMTIPSYPSSRCIWENSLTTRNFRAGL